MPTNINDIIKKLSPAQRKKVERRAEQLIVEEMTLRELRQARKMTQVVIAQSLGITQDSVSRLEQRSDMLLSTLQKSVKAMGGDLSLVVQFKDREPVILAGISGAELLERPATNAKAAQKHGHQKQVKHNHVMALA